LRLLIAAALILPLGAQGGVVWKADFENADLSEWSSYVLHPESWSFSPTPTPRSGQHCARVDLTNSDPYNGGERVEVIYPPPAAGFEGSELYYAFSTQLTSASPILTEDHAIAFFESAGPVYGSILTFHIINGNTVRLSTQTQDGSWNDRWDGPISYDVWHDFVLHVKWSLDPSVGFVHLFMDGREVLPKTSVRTMYSTDGATALTGSVVSVFHLGLMGPPEPGTPPVEVAFHDRVIVGTDWSDVVDGPDAGHTVDSGTAAVGGKADAGARTDAGAPIDAGAGSGSDADAGARDDGGSARHDEPSDAGNGPASGYAMGTLGCSHFAGLTPFAGALWLLIGRRRRCARGAL
jgi:hypothetical protein